MTIINPGPSTSSTANTTQVLSSSIAASFPVLNMPQMWIMGDSIALPCYDNQSASPSPIAEYRPMGLITQVNFLLGNRVRVVGNTAVTGTTSTQLRDTQLVQLLASYAVKPFQWVYMKTGTNDAIGDDTYSIIMASVNQLLALGIKVLFDCITPRGSLNAASATKFTTVNRRLRQAAENTQNFYVWDSSVVLGLNNAIAASIAYQPVSAYFQESNPTELHINPAGAIAAARAFVVKYPNLWPPAITGPINTNNQTNGDMTNAIANALFLGSGGTAGANTTGTIAANWSIAGVTTNAAVVASLTARTYALDGDTYGNWQVATVTNGAGAAVTDLIRINQTSNPLFNIGASPGDWLEYELEVDASVSVGSLYTVYSSCSIFTTGINSIHRCNFTGGGTTATQNLNIVSGDVYRGKFTGRVQIPLNANMATQTALFEVFASGPASAQYVIRVARVQVQVERTAQ